MAKKPKKKTRSRVKKKRRITVDKGIAHIKSSFNNTIVTITDNEGNVILTKSAGMIGYRGSKKGTAFAAQMVANEVASEVYDLGLKKVELYVRGPGSGRESAVRAFKASGLEITTIKEVTKIPHNGCRPKKRKRP